MLMTDDETAASIRFLPHVQSLLVRKGVTFTNAFVTTPLCCPSRTSYFTGQYAHNHGVLFNHGPNGGFHAFRHQDTTFPAALRRAGYLTAHIGKYLNGYGQRFGVPPGWDQFYGTVDPWTYNYYGFRLNHNGHILRFAPTERNYNTDVFAGVASSLIGRWAHSKPFFINVAFVAPHPAGNLDTTLRWEPDPVIPDPNEIDYRLAVPPLRYRGHFAHLPLPRPASFNQHPSPAEPSFLTERPLFRPFTPKDIRDITARYHAQLESLLAVDDAVDRIVNALRSTGELDRTVILFTSDNGFFNGEHRIRAGKYYAYDPATRVPLVIRGPGLPSGVTRSQIVANIDLAPTVLDLAHVRPLRPPDGLSLRAVLRDGRTQLQRDLLIETAPNDVYPVTYAGVRTSRYLYLHYSSGDRELFDLRHDPDEIHNLVRSRSVGGVERQLEQELGRLRSCAGATCRVASRQAS
jgi:arylsulfatase A-like enzyme